MRAHYFGTFTVHTLILDTGNVKVYAIYDVEKEHIIGFCVVDIISLMYSFEIKYQRTV